MTLDTSAATRRSVLDLDPEAFRALGHTLVDDLATFLERIRSLPVTPGESPGAVRDLLGRGGLPERGGDPKQLLERATRLVLEHSLFNGHPKFLGYITSSAAPLGALADLLAAVVNANVGAWELSPIASEIEAQSIRWIAELIGFPAGDGVLVSGGNMANFIGFLAARRAMAGAGIRTGGIEGLKLRIYASTETHTWIQKAADLFGHGTESVCFVPVDDGLAMDARALRAAIERDRAAGARPFLVVGTAGAVSTGAIDPLADIAAICREQGLWFHVDGAYGAIAAALPDASPRLRALSLADSVAVDPHKWLYAPIEAGAALVRDARALTDAFAWRPPYYFFNPSEDEPPVHYNEHGMQNSRGFRALKVWMVLQQAGRDGIVQAVGDDIALARVLQQTAAAHPELEPGPHGLSIATFRYVPRDLRGDAAAEPYLNKLNETLLPRLKEDGKVFVTNAVVGGRFLLRACIVNFRTTRADVEAVPEIVARMGRRVDAELRGRA